MSTWSETPKTGFLTTRLICSLVFGLNFHKLIFLPSLFTENGVSMFMWLGHNVVADWVQKVFSVQSAAQIDIDKVSGFFLSSDFKKSKETI